MILPSVELRLDRWGTLWVKAHYDDGGPVSLPVASWLALQKEPWKERANA